MIQYNKRTIELVNVKPTLKITIFFILVPFCKGFYTEQIDPKHNEVKFVYISYNIFAKPLNPFSAQRPAYTEGSGKIEFYSTSIRKNGLCRNNFFVLLCCATTCHYNRFTSTIISKHSSA